MNNKSNIKSWILFIVILALCTFMLFFGDKLPGTKIGTIINLLG